MRAEKFESQVIYSSPLEQSQYELEDIEHKETEHHISKQSQGGIGVEMREIKFQAANSPLAVSSEGLSSRS